MTPPLLSLPAVRGPIGYSYNAISVNSSNRRGCVEAPDSVHLPLFQIDCPDAVEYGTDKCHRFGSAPWMIRQDEQSHTVRSVCACFCPICNDMQIRNPFVRTPHQSAFSPARSLTDSPPGTAG